LILANETHNLNIINKLVTILLNDSENIKDNNEVSQDPQKKQNTEGQKKNFNYRKGYYRRKYKRPSERDASSEISKSINGINKISILIPLLNEEESLKPLYNEIKKVLKSLSKDYEILFIDDGSTDKSLNIIKELARFDNKIKFISFRKNYGKSAALQIGFKEVTGDVVVTMDADLQDDPNEIPNLLNKLLEGYDLISGWKKRRYDPFIKKYSSRFFNFTTRFFSSVKIHDFNCGLKIYRKEVVKDVKVYGELHRYIPVLAHWQGYRISEIPVKHHPRRYGKTKFGISRFFKGFVDLITVIFTTRYIKRPMHLFGFLGALAFIAGFFVNGYLTIEWLLGNSLSNRPLLFLGMLLIIVGIQFFSIGLLGEIMVHNFQSETEYSVKDSN